MLSSHKKKEIIARLDKALKSNAVQLACPMCGNQEFTIADGYTIQTLQDRVGTIQLGGPSIPCVSIICKNCGFVSQHAVGALGLSMDKEIDQ